MVRTAGWDTLIRIFDTKYYDSPAALSSSLFRFFSAPPEEGEGSSFACARRGDVSPAVEARFVNQEEVSRWMDGGRVDLFDLPGDLKEASSTEVRRRVQAGESIEGLVVAGVREVIEREGMYR